MKPGDKVVCVDDGPCKYCGVPVSIRKGDVYCVQGVEFTKPGNRPLLYLIGRKANNCHVTSGTMGFSARRFRKLDEIKAELAALESEPVRQVVEV